VPRYRLAIASRTLLLHPGSRRGLPSTVTPRKGGSVSKIMREEAGTRSRCGSFGALGNHHLKSVLMESEPHGRYGRSPILAIRRQHGWGRPVEENFRVMRPVTEPIPDSG
jgi:hypothetical protein